MDNETETKTFGQAMETALTQARTDATESPKPVIASLPDLDNLPDRLDDQTIRQLQTFASSPTPEPFPASERHFLQCLRILIANLPKKVTDDLGGELVVATYRRMLGHASDAAISYMTERALRQKWFPTIAECLAILEEWECPPDADRLKAGDAVARELHLRWEARGHEDLVLMNAKFTELGEMDWLGINSLPERWLRTAYRRGLLEEDGWHGGNRAYKLAGTPGQWGDAP